MSCDSCLNATVNSAGIGGGGGTALDTAPVTQRPPLSHAVDTHPRRHASTLPLPLVTPRLAPSDVLIPPGDPPLLGGIRVFGVWRGVPGGSEISGKLVGTRSK